MNKLNIYFIIIKLVVMVLFGNCWNLASIGLNESYSVLHLTIHQTRIFLSITTHSKAAPTLIQTHWPTKSRPYILSSIYPNPTIHANGNHHNCKLLQQSQWSQVDSLNRLWVMDAGWHGGGSFECSPKLLVFDLTKNNAEVLRIDCNKYITAGAAEVISMRLGPPGKSGCLLEKFLYFLLVGKSYILAYDILQQTWQRRALLSRKYDSIHQALPFEPLDLSFDRKYGILIADADGGLHSSRNYLLLNGNTSDEDGLDDVALEVDFLGYLLGPSRSMLPATSRNALFYVVPKYGAVVRVKPKFNLTAEDNVIVYMTSQNIQQIFFDNYASMWMLTDLWISPKDYCFSR